MNNSTSTLKHLQHQPQTNSISREAGIGGIIILFFILLGVAAPLITLHNPSEFPGQPLQAPSKQFWLGTNDLGQDIFSKLIFGARNALLIAAGTAAGTTLLAGLIGGMAGYMGGWTDRILMRITDILLTIPRLPLIILIVSFIGTGSLQTILIISLIYWPTPARVIRAEVLRLKQHGYIQIARRYGGKPLYIIRRHILPQIAPIVFSGMINAAGKGIAMEAGLAFLGLADPSAKSWGLMMRYAIDLPGILLTHRWIWWMLPPALCITLLILGFTYLGIGMEKTFQPRLRNNVK